MEKRAASRFSDFRGGAASLPTTTQQPAWTTSTSSSSRGSMTSSVPGRAARTSGRAALRPETWETHNNQSAVDATTPLCWMVLSAGGGGRGAPATAPGHPGAVGTRGGDVGEARSTEAARAGEKCGEKGLISIFGFSRWGSIAANNNTTTSLDDLDIELVPGFCDIVGPRASGGDVWARGVAAGNTGNTQQSIGGRRNNPPLPDDPR